MKSALATVLGFLAAPLIPAGYFAIVYPLSGYQEASSIVGTFVIAYFFGVVFMFGLGVPILILLNKLKLVRWWSATGSGAFVGIVLLFVITSGNGIDRNSLCVFSVLGGITGFVSWIFWRIAIMREV